MSILLEARGLTCLHPGGRGLRDATFTLEDKEIVGLVGVNGAGKTTLLRLLAGLLRPQSGSARLLGLDLVDGGVEARRRLAFVPDTPALYDELTVEEHLLFMAQVHRVADWRTRRDEVLDRMGLEARRRDVVATLSHGLRQRTSLACALLASPALVLLDEPLNGLDPLARRALLVSLQEAASTGATVLVSSHQVELLERACSRFLVLHDGRLRHDGPLEAGQGGRDALESLLLRLAEAEPAR